MGGNTQNNNESFNSVLWSMAPKHIFCSAKTIELAALLSACVFNEGMSPLIRVINIMGIKIGQHAKAAADASDNVRVRKAEVAHSTASEEARTSRRMERTTQDDWFEEQEGGLYGPSIAD